MCFCLFLFILKIEFDLRADLISFCLNYVIIECLMAIKCHYINVIFFFKKTELPMK